jgi:guanine nucleotide-binding protein subunit beta-2-like 1 protein
MEDKKYILNNNFCGFLEGHTDSVSSIVIGHSSGDEKDSTIVVVSASRDTTILIWKLNPDLEHNHAGNFGEPFIALTGHTNFVSDLSLSPDNDFLISSSWDNSLRLWDLKSCKCMKIFSVNNKSKIFSTTFANDCRQIFSCGSDKKLSLWNTQGKLMMGSQNSNHQDWVSRVRNSPSAKNKFYASVGGDGSLKIWTDFFKLKTSIKAHDGPINALAINVNGLFIATGGKDKTVKVWKVKDLSKPFKTYKCNSVVHDVAFHPEVQWVAAATVKKILIWHIADDSNDPIVVIPSLDKKTKFSSLAWSSSGKYLYAGATDGLIRVHNIEISEK